MADISQHEIIFIIFTVSSGILLLVAAIGVLIVIHQKRIFQAHQLQLARDREYAQKMIEAQMDSQEQERKRIAADLHDSLGSLLWGAKVNASFIQRSIELSGSVKDSHDELVQILEQSITTVRRISWELTPEAFHHAGFSTSVRKLCDQFNDKGIEISLNETDSQYWNDDRAMHAFRIVQELISNSVKHSGASIISVIITWKQTSIEIMVSDDGKGFSLETNRQGVGWWNINHRLKKLNSEIKIGIPPSGRGVQFLIKIPLTYDSEKN
ncbi:hypothetical protein WSM22_39670 [Cytophagales bacterium WSM2-2]|nr:hypothetical protein WSM22_39670 [Cytophagales bacterium WSM2-2]